MNWYQEDDDEEEDLMFSPALLARRASESWIVAPPVEVETLVLIYLSIKKFYFVCPRPMVIAVVLLPFFFFDNNFHCTIRLCFPRAPAHTHRVYRFRCNCRERNRCRMCRSCRVKRAAWWVAKRCLLWARRDAKRFDGRSRPRNDWRRIHCCT